MIIDLNDLPCVFISLFSSLSLLTLVLYRRQPMSFSTVSHYSIRVERYVYCRAQAIDDGKD